MADEIGADLVLRVLNSLSDDKNDGKYVGDELGLIAKILAAKCPTDDRVRILAAALANNREMEDALMDNDSGSFASDLSMMRPQNAARAWHVAKRDTTPILGEDAALACSTAAEMYRKALQAMGADNVNAIPASTLPGFYRAMRSAGQTARGPQEFTGAGFARDSAAPIVAGADADFRKQFPTAGNVVRS